MECPDCPKVFLYLFIIIRLPPAFVRRNAEFLERLLVNKTKNAYITKYILNIIGENDMIQSYCMMSFKVTCCEQTKEWRMI